MTVLFAVVLVAGYVALWVIWRKFFRGSYRHDEETVESRDRDP